MGGGTSGVDSKDHTLDTIRDMLARRRQFTGVPPIATALVGAMGCCTGAIVYLNDWSFHNRDNVPCALTLWVVTLVVATGVYLVGVSLSARRRKTQSFSIPARFAYSCQFVAMTAAAIMTIALFQVEQAEMVPMVWLLSYGIGAWPAAFVAGWAFSMMSLGFLICGALAAFWPTYDALWLGLGFGGMHIVLAGGLIASVRS